MADTLMGDTEKRQKCVRQTKLSTLCTVTWASRQGKQYTLKRSKAVTGRSKNWHRRWCLRGLENPTKPAPASVRWCCGSCHTGSAPLFIKSGRWRKHLRKYLPPKQPPLSKSYKMRTAMGLSGLRARCRLLKHKKVGFAVWLLAPPWTSHGTCGHFPSFGFLAHKRR